MSNWLPLPIVIGQLLMGVVRTNWIPFMSREGGFVLTMPGEPREQTVPRDLPGGHIKRHKFCIQPPGDNRIFSISYFALPPTAASRPADVPLTGAANNLATKVAAGGKLLTNRRFSVQGVPCREVTLVSREGDFMVDRMFVANRRFYQLMFTAPGERALDADGAKFISSFRFLQKR